MSNTPYVFSDIMRDAIRGFGEAPDDELERRLIDRFQREPELFANAIKSVQLGFADKTIRKPWAVVDLQTRLAIAKLGTSSEADRREAAITRARRWTETVGFQFPLSSFEDELYVRPGPLARYRDDSALRAELRELWAKHQPSQAPEPAPTTGAAA